MCKQRWETEETHLVPQIWPTAYGSHFWGLWPTRPGSSNYSLSNYSLCHSLRTSLATLGRMGGSALPGCFSHAMISVHHKLFLVAEVIDRVISFIPGM